MIHKNTHFFRANVMYEGENLKNKECQIVDKDYRRDRKMRGLEDLPPGKPYYAQVMVWGIPGVLSVPATTLRKLQVASHGA